MGALQIVGQVPRLPREYAITRQAGRLPYNRKHGLPRRAMRYILGATAAR